MVAGIRRFEDPNDPFATSWRQRTDDELALADNEERLPWLSGDDEETAPRRVDSGRLLGFALLLLTVGAIVLGGLWWAMNRTQVGGQPADGSIIAAPAGPYRTKPVNPGGKVHEGTGDTSFAVGEGQRREGQVATRNVPPPPPAPASTASASAGLSSPAASPKPSSRPDPTVSVPGVGVQVGAYARRDQAEAGWATLTRQTEALSGLRHRVVEGQADIGTVFRLQAVTPDRASANALCAALRADGLPCQVK